jgi:hypothetical protein
LSAASQPARGLCDLFERIEIAEFIEEASTATPVSIFAGAGTSIESGFPDWDTLVYRLLVGVAAEEGLSDGAQDQFASWTTGREGLTAAAAVAQAHLGDEFSHHLHRALYEQQLTPPAGQSAVVIARLMESFGPTSCNVVTTNYDLVLDKAIDEASIPVAATPAGAQGNRRAKVTHLHGAVTPRGRIRGEVILSDRDYFLMQEDTAWQQERFADLFEGTTCIFVGASLTDPNLLRYLHRCDTTKDHYAIFVRQQDSGLYDKSEQVVIDLREVTSEARWKNSGIHPIHADYYSQSAQLLHEVLHRRKTVEGGRTYQSLPKRLIEWRDRLDQDVLSTASPSFKQKQEELQRLMNHLLDGIRNHLAKAGHRPRRNERLGINMWVYDPRTESLTNWASADRIWLDPRTLEPLPVDWTSDFVSVQAFCAGSLVARSTERYVATRWNHVIGIPLHVESETAGRLPVGSLTIASTFVPPESVLHRGMQTLRRASLSKAEEVLAEVLQ